MRNSLLKYDRTTFYTGYSVTDYTSKNLDQILDFPELTDPTFITYYQLIDNETIEQVSHKLYGTAMYWDVILLINMIDPLFDMVYDFDFSRDIAVKYIDYYNEEVIDKSELIVPISLPTDYLDALKDAKTAELELLKESKRPIKVVRHNKILDFMKLVRQNEII